MKEGFKDEQKKQFYFNGLAMNKWQNFVTKSAYTERSDDLNMQYIG